MPPVNDNFADATLLSGASGSLVFSNVGATAETGEPDNAEGHSVWFKWTPPGGTVYVRTSATPLPTWDSYLAVLTGDSVTTLTEVAHDDDGDLQPGTVGTIGTSRAQWVADGTTTYYIQVTAFDDVSEPVERSDAVLTWAVVVIPIVLPVPDITLVSPDSGVVGELITITGSNLSLVTGVTVGTAEAAVNIVSAATLTFSVPFGAAGNPAALVAHAPDGDSNSVNFTPVYLGSWLQPADQVGTIRREADSANVTQVFPDGVPPSYPPSTVTPLYGGFLTWQVIWNVPDSQWTRNLGIGFLFADIIEIIDVFAHTVLAPYEPSPADVAAADAFGYELEHPTGTARGTFTIDVEMVRLADHTIPDETSTPPAKTEVDSSTINVYRLPGSAYTFDDSNTTFPHVVLSSWLTAAAITSFTHLYGQGVDGGGPLIPAAGFTPTTLWQTQDAFDPAPTLHYTFADLDSNGAVTLVVAPSMYLTESTRLPDNQGGRAQVVREEAQVQGWGDQVAVVSLPYQPPRYRFLYNQPQAGDQPQILGNIKGVFVSFDP